MDRYLMKKGALYRAPFFVNDLLLALLNDSVTPH